VRAGVEFRLAHTPSDLRLIEALRHRCFGLRPAAMEARMRRRDLHSQHLIAVDPAARRAVGCCRLTSDFGAMDFDASDSFALGPVLSGPGAKVELSYVCVDPEMQNGLVIRTLLAMVREYCRAAQVARVFGCASLLTSDAREAEAAYRVLNGDGVLMRETLSPLLRFYFHLGAQVYGPPVYDPHFRCFDFLMVLNFKRLDPRTWDRILRL
jgi:putative hemolysin